MEVFSPAESRRVPEADLSEGILTEDELKLLESDEGDGGGGGGGGGLSGGSSSGNEELGRSGPEGGKLLTRENWILLDRLLTLQDRYELPEEERKVRGDVTTFCLTDDALNPFKPHDCWYGKIPLYRTQA